MTYNIWVAFVSKKLFLAFNKMVHILKGLLHNKKDIISTAADFPRATYFLSPSTLFLDLPLSLRLISGPSSTANGIS